MNDSFTIDQGQSRDRRASDKPRASGSQSRFNPLHPSLELPPEQLIRLLGLEDKQSRKRHKHERDTATTAVRPNTVPAGNDRPAAPAAPPKAASALPRMEVPSDHPMYQKRRQRHLETAPFSPRRSNLLWPAAGIGIVGGLIVSAYIFWWQPTSGPTSQATVQTTQPAPVVRSTPAAAAAVKTVPAAKPVTATPAPAQRAPLASTPPPATPAPAPVEDPAWRAAVEKQEQRLQEAAEKRLLERMRAGGAAPADTASAGLAGDTPPSAPRPEPTVDSEYQAQPSLQTEPPVEVEMEMPAPMDTPSQAETPTATEPEPDAPAPADAAASPSLQTPAVDYLPMPADETPVPTDAAPAPESGPDDSAADIRTDAGGSEAPPPAFNDETVEMQAQPAQSALAPPEATEETATELQPAMNEAEPSQGEGNAP